MNQDEIEKMLNVATQSWQNQEKFEIEAYISSCKQKLILDMRTDLTLSANGLPEPTRSHVQNWIAQNKERFALQVGAVIEMMLRKELLGE